MRAATLCLVHASLALAACGQPAPGNPARQAYQCGDLAVTAEFPTADAVTLAWPENSLALKRVPAASGAKYADDAGNEFWTKDGALLTLAGQAMRRCALT